jgi:hypothetical protein
LVTSGGLGVIGGDTMNFVGLGGCNPEGKCKCLDNASFIPSN